MSLAWLGQEGGKLGLVWEDTTDENRLMEAVFDRERVAEWAADLAVRGRRHGAARWWWWCWQDAPYFSGYYYIAFSTRLNRMTLYLANLPISRQEILNEFASVMI
jgi:hypothetical protein